MKPWKHKVKNIQKKLSKNKDHQITFDYKLTNNDKKKFYDLHHSWINANGFWSHRPEKMKDKHYKILRNSFPDKVLAKLIFNYIQNTPSWIINILPELTGHNLDIPEKYKYDVQYMVDAWIEWAKNNNCLDN